MTIWRRSLCSWGFSINSTRRALALGGLLLLGLAFFAPVPSSAQVPRGRAMVRASLVSRSLAREIRKVRTWFEKNHESLKPRELLKETERRILEAIENVNETGLAAMQDWVRAEFSPLHEELDASTVFGTADARRRHPQPVAVVASLSPMTSDENNEVSNKPPSSKKSIVSKVGSIIQWIFVLSKEEDVWIKVYVRRLVGGQADLYLYTEKELKAKGEPPCDSDSCCRADSTLHSLTGKHLWLYRGDYSYELAKQRSAPLFCCPASQKGCTLHLMHFDGIECSLKENRCVSE